MSKFYFIIAFIIIVGFMFKGFSQNQEVKLPSPKKEGNISLGKALDERRSIREYSAQPLSLEEMSGLLWAAYGKNKWGRLTVPSAGALYPLSIYVAIGKVEDLPSGLYRYNNQNHSLVLISSKDLRAELSGACLNQSSVKNAPISIIICADYDITVSHYGQRGKRYVDIEVGHVGENIYLQATSLGLGTVAIGAFSDEVKKVIKIEEDPLYVMPVGRIK
jgi:SagB-type dehydrogenase family enzyme